MSLENSYRQKVDEDARRQQALFLSRRDADRLFEAVVAALYRDRELGPFIRTHGLKVMTHCARGKNWEASYFWILRAARKSFFGRSVKQANVSGLFHFCEGSVRITHHRGHDDRSFNVDGMSGAVETVLRILREDLGPDLAEVEMRD